MAIFLTVVLTVYILVNLYLWLKGRKALSGAGLSTSWYTAIFVALASTFVLGKFLEHSWTNLLTDILNVTGGFWMGFMLYGFLAWLAADILLLLQKPFHLVPVEALPKLRLWIFTGITSGVVLLIIIGFFNTISPRTKNMTCRLQRSLSPGNLCT